MKKRLRLDILARKEDILEWIEQNQSKAFMCRELKCKPETLNSYLKKMNIEYGGNQGGKGIKSDSKYMTAEEYIQNSTCIKSHVLKIKLIRDGIKEEKCEICGISIWQGVKLPLELHHKDGNHFNNNLDNLQILCPNCHSIQEGNSGANAGKYAAVSELVQETDLESLEKIKTHQIKRCAKCGKEISAKAQYCEACGHEMTRKCERPTREELKDMIREMPFTHIGVKYFVTDNAIRKWCKSYGLPCKKKEIEAISDEDWENI